MKTTLGKRQEKLIDNLVEHFKAEQEVFITTRNTFKAIIESSGKLNALVHSVKHRIKNPEHLRDKLTRKFLEAKAKGKTLKITKDNLAKKISDLVGFRLIHLHTTQYKEIDRELKRIFKDSQYNILSGPTARTWDDESRSYFLSIGIDVDDSPNMYTSIHYIVQVNSRSGITFEIQVRTLMEEVWGEVDHTINYPHKAASLSCREQIKVLARMTSSSSRLVDSIFTTHADFLSSSLPKLSIQSSGPKTRKKRSKPK